MSKSKYSRYGLSPEEVDRLTGRWSHGVKSDSTFESLDAFLRWASVGYKKGVQLRKRDESKPHGPGNSYWLDGREERYVPNGKQVLQRVTYCSGCTRDCQENGNGCVGWREYFVRNWNENIHREVKNVPRKREFFCYEHPDLVREGIHEHAT